MFKPNVVPDKYEKLELKYVVIDEKVGIFVGIDVGDWGYCLGWSCYWRWGWCSIGVGVSVFVGDGVRVGVVVGVCVGVGIGL